MNPPYPPQKKLVIEEASNTIEKLTEEFGISPMYSAIQMGAYSFAQVAAMYEKKGKKMPKELVKFLEVHYPKMLAECESIIQEEYTLLNTDGTA